MMRAEDGKLHSHLEWPNPRKQRKNFRKFPNKNSYIDLLNHFSDAAQTVE